LKVKKGELGVDEPRDVIWEKNGNMICNDDAVEIGYDGTCNFLTIEHAELEDAGLYEVFGERNTNEITFSTLVQVGDKKPPPVAPKKKPAPGVAKKPGSTHQQSIDEAVAKTPPQVARKPSKTASEEGDSSPVKSPPPTPKKPSAIRKGYFSFISSRSLRVLCCLYL